MGDWLSIIEFMQDKELGLLLSIAVILIGMSFILLSHEYKEPTLYYIFHKRNRGYLIFSLLYMAAILLLVKFETLSTSSVIILFTLNVLYFALCIVGIKKPIGLAGFKLKQYENKLATGGIFESKNFFESNHWYLIDSIDKVRFAQLQSRYYAVIEKNKESFDSLHSISHNLLYKNEQQYFLVEKAYLLFKMGDFSALKEILYLLESDSYQSQDPRIWQMKSLIEEERGNLDGALSFMEISKAKLNRDESTREVKVSILNDFGRIQLMRGNKSEAYHYYKQSFKELIKDAKVSPQLLHPIASNVIAMAILMDLNSVQYYFKEYRKHLDMTIPENLVAYKNCEIIYYRQIRDTQNEFKKIKEGYEELAFRLDPVRRALFQVSTFRMIMNGKFQYEWLIPEIESSLETYFELPPREKLTVFKEFIGILEQEEFRYVKGQEPFKNLIHKIYEYYRTQGLIEIESMINSLGMHEIYLYHQYTLDKLAILKLLDKEQHIEKSESTYLELYKTLYDAGLHITAANVLFTYIDECSNPNNILVSLSHLDTPITYQEFLENIPSPPPPYLLEDGIHLNYFYLNLNENIEIIPQHRDKIEKYIEIIITDYHKWQNHPIKLDFSLHIAYILASLDRKQEAEGFYRFFVDSKISINQYVAWMQKEYAMLEQLFDGMPNLNSKS